MVGKDKTELFVFLFSLVVCVWARGSCGATPRTSYWKKSRTSTQQGTGHGKDWQVSFEEPYKPRVCTHLEMYMDV